MRLIKSESELREALLHFTDDECPGKKGERIRGRKKIGWKKEASLRTSNNGNENTKRAKKPIMRLSC